MPVPKADAPVGLYLPQRAANSHQQNQPPQPPWFHKPLALRHYLSRTEGRRPRSSPEIAWQDADSGRFAKAGGVLFFRHPARLVRKQPNRKEFPPARRPRFEQSKTTITVVQPNHLRRAPDQF